MNENKLIAEFMGHEILYRPYSNGFIELSETQLCDVDDLLYHKSWDWLMPVVDMCYQNGAEGNDIGDITHALLDFNLEATYNAVVEFIKSYRQIDYFEHHELLPQEVQDLLVEFGMTNEFTYETCKRLVTELNKLGWTCDYDLSGEPFDLKPL